MLSVPSLISLPPLIRPSAAFLSDMEMAALLFVVPTMRFTLVTMPLSSVL